MNWNEKFSQTDFTYGTEPNDFLKSMAEKIKPRGNVLSLCEGEGRNGVFLAELGFHVVAVDGSSVGLEKARKLAEERKVEIQTIVADLADYKIEPDSWDAIVIIFGHLPVELRRSVNPSIVKGLKKGGVFVLEGYSQNQLQYDTGGPKDYSMLYDLGAVKSELAGLDFEIARELEREIIEGKSHTGIGSVVQILARKP
jgi:SAM-dependent methyltransferase